MNRLGILGLLRGTSTIGLLLAAALSHATPSYVGASTQASSSPTNSVSLARPAALAAGDLMLAILVQRSGNLPLDQNMVSVPSGWVLVRSQDDGSSIGLAIYRKLASASEPSSYSWTLGSSGRTAAATLAFRGVDATTPIDASGSQANAASSTYTAPSVTTSTVNTLVVSFHTTRNGNSGIVDPGGMTQVVNIATGAGPNGLSLGVSDVAQAGAGASGDKLSTGNPTLVSLGALVALRSGSSASGPDHYELSLPTNSLTCMPTTVTVKACSTNAATCSAEPTANGTAVLTTSAGALGSSVLNFSGGVATTTLSMPGGADGSTATLSLSAESTVAANPRQCCPNGSACFASNSCSTTFNRAGFIVAASAGGAITALPAQTAGTSSGTYVLRAVRSGTSTQACEPALSGANTVDWAYQCNNPSNCSASNLMTVTGSAATPIQRNNAGATLSYTAVPMVFDANGNAPFTFNFADVGQTTLYFNRTVNGDLVSGNSGSFVTRPANFTVTNIANAASPFTANPSAANASGAAFMAAGAAFGARITAVTSGGAATPNFGQESPAEGVLLTPSLVQPAGGTNPPTLTNGSIAGSQFSAGVANVSNLAYAEVGIIQLTPSTSDGNYLGSGNVAGTATANIGRFTPAGFTVAYQAPVQRSQLSCASPSAFTYFGEPFQLRFTLTAVNAQGTATQNYDDGLGFAKLDLTAAASYQLAGVSGGTQFVSPQLGATLGSGTQKLEKWASGVASTKDASGNPAAGVVLVGTVAAGASPSGPFNTSFGIAPTDADGVALTAASLNLDTNPSVPGNDHALIGQILLRQGRLRLQNGMSAANRTLTLPLAAEYWDSTLGAFTTNTLDSCTAIAAANLSFGNYRKNLDNGDTALVTSPVTLASGRGALTLKAPASGHLGSMDIAAALGAGANPADASCLKAISGWTPAIAASTGANLTGLRGAWCGGSRDPSARATWGLYRGSNGIVFQRENY